MPDHVDFQVSTGDVHLNCFYPGCGATTRVWQIGAAGWDVGPWVSDHAHGETVGPLSEVLPETPEPTGAQGCNAQSSWNGNHEIKYCARPIGHPGEHRSSLVSEWDTLKWRDDDDPVPASQSVPAVPVSSTGGKETGEAAETATEALSAVGVGSLSEAIGLALNDTYAGMEFEDPTFESGTMAIMAVLREHLADWRPPLPEGGEEIGDDVIVHFEGRPVVGRPLSVKVGWEGDQFVELPRDFAVPASSPLPDSETEPEHADDCTGCDGPGIVPCAADRVIGDFAYRNGVPIKDLRAVTS